MKLRDVVIKTLEKNGGALSHTDRVVASLISAGYKHIITKDQVSNIRKLVIGRQTVISSTLNPLRTKVTAGFNNNRCPYCAKEMKVVQIAGDKIKKALFCKEDRLTIPLANE